MLYFSSGYKSYGKDRGGRWMRRRGGRRKANEWMEGHEKRKVSVSGVMLYFSSSG